MMNNVKGRHLSELFSSQERKLLEFVRKKLDILLTVRKQTAKYISHSVCELCKLGEPVGVSHRSHGEATIRIVHWLAKRAVMSPACLE